jgi:hypothetical protein
VCGQATAEVPSIGAPTVNVANPGTPIFVVAFCRAETTEENSPGLPEEKVAMPGKLLIEVAVVGAATPKVPVTVVVILKEPKTVEPIVVAGFP